MSYPSPTHTDFLEWFKAISTACVALVIGILAWSVARRQKDIAEAKLKLDLFGRRYAIFEQVFQITLDTCQYTPNHDKFKDIVFGDSPYERFKPEASFLFGPGMYLYIDELSRKWKAYRAHEQSMKVTGVTDPLEDNTALVVYFAMAAQIDIQEQFSPFLDFANWKTKDPGWFKATCLHLIRSSSQLLQIRK